MPHLHSTNIVARLNLPNMAYPAERRIEVYASAQEGLAELEPKPKPINRRRMVYDGFRCALPILRGLDELARKRSGLEYLETVLRYLSRGTDKLKPDDLRQAVTQALTRGDEIMPTLAEQWIQQGVQQGLAAERQLLLRQIRHRFGAGRCGGGLVS